jgi:hypothetical protein
VGAPFANLKQVGRTSFGDVGDSAFSARGTFESARTKEIGARQAFYECRNHDHKKYDFDGRMLVTTGSNVISATQPLLSGEKAAYFVPLRNRRPSSPYRLARVIVNAFTNMIFGEGRFPRFRVEGDKDTEQFIAAVSKAAQLPVKMIRARTLGGACGSVGLSWAFIEGRPRVSVHNAAHMYFHTWEDREEGIPRHVTECYQYPQDDWDSQKKRYVRNMYWYRRDWTPNADVIFLPILVEPGKDPSPDEWEPDVEKSSLHNDGLTHFVWIQNLPSEDVDGLPDYDGLYEQLEMMDLLLSVMARGAVLNLDPTLKLKMDPGQAKFSGGVKKGSDNALFVGEAGDANYLELSGSSILAGIQLFNSKRASILEVAQCVIPDSDKIAAAGTSSVALKMVYAPMLGKCDGIREQYAAGMTRLLAQMHAVATANVNGTVVVFDADGQPSQEERALNLPPKVNREPAMDDEGNPTGEEKVSLEDHTPGEGGDIEAEWGPYFQPTPDDITKSITPLVQATGQQAFMSIQSAAEIAAATYGRTPNEEWMRLQQANAVNEQKQAEMFSAVPQGAGGKRTLKLANGSSVTHQMDGAPPEGEQMPETGDDAAGHDIELAPTDLAAIITVNEARKTKGLPPILGEDGDMPIAAFKTKYAKSIAAAANADLGKVGDPPDADVASKDPPPGGGFPPGHPGGPPGGPPHPGGPPGQPGAPPGHPGAPAPGAGKPPFPTKK